MARDTIGALDQYKSEINGKISHMSADHNEQRVYKSIRDMITEFSEDEIDRQSLALERAGAEHGQAIGRDVNRMRRRTSEEYRDFAKMSNELLDHLGAGRFSGAETLKMKLKSLSGEQLNNKFSPKGNVEFIPFLAKHFPDTLEQVQKDELRRVVAPC